MRNAPRDANFVTKALEGFLVGGGLGQEFERDLLSQTQVIGAVDLAHSATAK